LSLSENGGLVTIVMYYMVASSGFYG
jgi:hypothetical protein